MRSHPGSFLLSFLLPADWRLAYDGPQPAASGCTLKIAGPVVSIEGNSRESVFDAGAWLLRAVHDFTSEPICVAATVDGPGGIDKWSIAVGADVAFAPTGLGHNFPRSAA